MAGGCEWGGQTLGLLITVNGDGDRLAVAGQRFGHALGLCESRQLRPARRD